MSIQLTQGLLCVEQTNYRLRNDYHFLIPIFNSVYHGSESITNLGPRIWYLVYVTAIGLEPTTTQFVKEHSTI